MVSLSGKLNLRRTSWVAKLRLHRRFPADRLTVTCVGSLSLPGAQTFCAVTLAAHARRGLTIIIHCNTYGALEERRDE